MTATGTAVQPDNLTLFALHTLSYPSPILVHFISQMALQPTDLTALPCTPPQLMWLPVQ